MAEKHWFTTPRVIALIGVAVLVVLAVGILVMSSPDDDVADPDPSEDSTDQTSGSVRDITVPPGTAGDFVGARTDVTDLACEHAGDRWTVSGSVTNPTDEQADYRIYVSFIDAERQTRGLLQVDVEGVDPAESEDWQGELAVGAEDLDCVLRVERATQSG